MSMNIKRVFVIGTAGFALVCMGLFYILNSSLSLRSNNKIDYEKVEAKLESLEKAIQSHRKSMDELDTLVQIADLESDGKNEYKVDKDNNGLDGVNSVFGKKDPKVCVPAFGIENEAKSDINMLGVYEELPFDDPKGGAWTQGWDVQIDPSRFSDNNKLKIFLIPHSHNDPGWIKTFEAYYASQTKSILNSMLDRLSLNPTLKFIWAEISYFSLWWDEITDDEKAKVKKLISNKQLEFVTGGWVMPDESSPHYYAMLIQLIEGHQWLLHHLDYVPKNGWSIDPFGMSPTNAYLLKRTGLSNMLIQRTHYAVKKYLAQKQELEFKWRQNWDPYGTADMLCHMMPFYSYDVPHTCGPDPAVCCQFDFKRMRSVSHISCPWHKPPMPITPHNVKTRAELLLDQYKKKAMLYKTNVLLVPLGDDFRWDDVREWDAQANNYGKLFDYINSHEKYQTEAKFGTLEDYFVALHREVSTGNFEPKVLSGDFFTYSDRNDHYWSGYFTSRPFHKASDRQLIALLQSAQLSFTLMVAEVSRKWGDPAEVQFIRHLMGKLIASRRALSIFQHHDGIAGTAKDHVVVDYAKKLLTAMNDCNHVMQQSLHILTHLQDSELNLGEIGDVTQFSKPIISKDTHDELPHYNYLVLDQEISLKVIKVLNPSARKRSKLVKIYVSTYKIQVADLEGNMIPHEVFPVFESEFKISDNNFEVSFVAHMEPISVKNYLIKYSSEFSPTVKPEILVFNLPGSMIAHKLFDVNSMPGMEPIQISNGYITVSFNENGFMKSASINQREVQAEIKFMSYGAQNRAETSGLYLFFPDGDATALPVTKPMIRVIKGRLQSYVEVWLTQIKHRITVYNHPGFERYAIEVKNLVDIRKERNFELSMNVKTNLESDNVFYTDLNAFQMIKRKWHVKLPVQANFYPIPSAAFIQNKETRMTILSAQALGGASLKSGELEIMMDRRLMQDDNRGAGQGCMDNLETMHSFKIIFESMTCEDDSNTSTSPPMLSLPAHLQLEDLLSPLQIFGTFHQSSTDSKTGVADYIPSGQQPGVSCDVQLLSTLPLPEYTDSLDDHSYVVKPKTSLLFHRYGFDGRWGSIPLPNCALESSKLGRFNVTQVFGGDLLKPKMLQATLSFLIEGKDLATNDSILMKPMEVYGFVVGFNVNRNL